MCCWFLTRFVFTTGANNYYECLKCKNRSVSPVIGGCYQPIDRKWLKGEEE